MNIAYHVERGYKLFPHKTALIFEGKFFTYKDIDQQANRVANSLLSLGIGRGQRVALFLPNIPEFIFAYLGILKIGAIAVSINAMLMGNEIEFILNDCAASLLVTTELLSNNVVKQNLPKLKHILIVEGKSNRGTNLKELLSRASSKFDAVVMKRDEIATIVYTSGTTGFPKGVMLSHGNVISNIYAKNRCCRMKPHDRLLLYLPLFHCFGQNAILNAGFNACATIILQRRFHPEQVSKAITNHAVTMFFGVPTVFIRLLELDTSNYDFSSIHYYFTAASPMPKTIVRRWQEKFDCIIHEGYGLTEASPFVSYNHDLKYKFGSIGTPIENVEMKIVDIYGESVEPGELGEIVVRGPNVMMGYWNLANETAQVLKKGWLHTGDIGRMDDEGYFYIVDRLKDMINVSGYKVYPAEVESVIYQHSAIAECLVYGVPDSVKGEIVKAKILLKQGAVITEEQLLVFCHKRMATYKVPNIVEFTDSIPKNETGKISKKLLLEKAV